MGHTLWSPGELHTEVPLRDTRWEGRVKFQPSQPLREAVLGKSCHFARGNIKTCGNW